MWKFGFSSLTYRRLGYTCTYLGPIFLNGKTWTLENYVFFPLFLFKFSLFSTDFDQDSCSLSQIAHFFLGTCKGFTNFNVINYKKYNLFLYSCSTETIWLASVWERDSQEFNCLLKIKTFRVKLAFKYFY